MRILNSHFWMTFESKTPSQGPKTNWLIKSDFRFLYEKNNINFYYERKKYYKKFFRKKLWLGIEELEKKPLFSIRER